MSINIPQFGVCNSHVPFGRHRASLPPSSVLPISHEYLTLVSTPDDTRLMLPPVGVVRLGHETKNNISQTITCLMVYLLSM